MWNMLRDVTRVCRAASENLIVGAFVSPVMFALFFTFSLLLPYEANKHEDVTLLYSRQR